jgi:prefoldin subunit 5
MPKYVLTQSLRVPNQGRFLPGEEERLVPLLDEAQIADLIKRGILAQVLDVGVSIGAQESEDVESLRSQIERLQEQAETTDRNHAALYEAFTGISDENVALTAQLKEAKGDAQKASELVASMHAAAVGEVRGPIRGVLEDVADLHDSRERANSQIEQLTNERADLRAENDKLKAQLDAQRADPNSLEAVLEGVDKRIVPALKKAGFDTLEKVVAASDESLVNVAFVTGENLPKIRAAIKAHSDAAMAQLQAPAS